MASRAAGRVALMAMHPQYANAILDGTKQVEFRKRRLASDVGVVLIYATSPVRRIVGLFTVEDVVAAAPKQLWDQFAQIGGVDEADFHNYFGDSDVGVGLVVKRAYRLPDAVALDCIEPTPTPPQSFSYLRGDSVSHVVRFVSSVLDSEFPLRLAVVEPACGREPPLSDVQPPGQVSKCERGLAFLGADPTENELAG